MSLREELQSLPLGELLKLKEELGSKEFVKTLYSDEEPFLSPTSSHGLGKQPTKGFRRDKKKRPREMSSKVPVKKLMANSLPKLQRSCDPRFDEHTGEFDKKLFLQNYDFLKDMRLQEKRALLKEMKDTSDPELKDKLKLLLRRMKDKEANEQADEKRKSKLRQLRKQNEERLKLGKKPIFVKRRELRRQELEEKYHDLSKNKKLDKYLAKKRKKQATKEMRALPSQAL